MWCYLLHFLAQKGSGSIRAFQWGRSHGQMKESGYRAKRFWAHCAVFFYKPQDQVVWGESFSKLAEESNNKSYKKNYTNIVQLLVQQCLIGNNYNFISYIVLFLFKKKIIQNV
jgi:hypothetical protein